MKFLVKIEPDDLKSNSGKYMVQVYREHGRVADECICCAARNLTMAQAAVAAEAAEQSFYFGARTAVEVIEQNMAGLRFDMETK